MTFNRTRVSHHPYSKVAIRDRVLEVPPTRKEVSSLIRPCRLKVVRVWRPSFGGSFTFEVHGEIDDVLSKYAYISLKLRYIIGLKTVLDAEVISDDLN